MCEGRPTINSSIILKNTEIFRKDYRLMNNLEGVKSLGVIAARLLLLYLLDGPNPPHRTIEEEMQAVGTARRQTIYNAQAELRKAGFITTRRTRYATIVTLPSSIVGVGWGNVPLTKQQEELGSNERVISECLEGSCASLPSGLNGRVNPDVTESVTSQRPQIQQKVLHLDRDVTESVTSQTIPDVTESVTSHPDVTESVTSHPDVTESVTSRMERVDAMDESGSQTSKSSPFALRRAEQVKLIREVWPTIFPQDYKLSNDNAKTFIGWSDNSALTCYERLEEIARVKPNLSSPVAYLRKALKNWGTDRVGERNPASSLVGAAVVERPHFYAVGEKVPPTPEFLEALREAHAQGERTKKQKGWEE